MIFRMMNADYYREQPNRALRLANEFANRPDIAAPAGAPEAA